jgi:hypothetical protein
MMYGIAAGQAADLLWEVENPYRFFKRTSSFEIQEKAFNAVRGAPGQPLPTNILWKVERRLDNPDCKDSSTLAANTHREGISPFDDLQPAYTALCSDAFHPTAEGHDRRRPRSVPRQRTSGKAIARAELNGLESARVARTT